MSNPILRLTPENKDAAETYDSSNILIFPQTADQLKDIFIDVESYLPFREGDEFDNMLTFTDNLKEPIHRWYQYKEGYSHRLVNKILELYPMPSENNTVLDPFAGAGTTLLTAQANGLPSVGIELNPFAALLSQVKTCWNDINSLELSKALDKIIKKRKFSKVQLPTLTTFHNEKYFPDNNAYKLFELKNAIIESKFSHSIKNTLLIALTSSIEDVSCLHKDGRLLRYRAKNVISPKEAFKNHVQTIIEDLEISKEKNNIQSIVLQGDSRNLNGLLETHKVSKSFGLVLYSPPYPNNFDYCEVYKCELWLLGLVSSYEQWRNLRQMTFRSHPSCQFPVTHYLRDHKELKDVYVLVEQLAKCSNIGGYAQEQAPKVIRGYFDDVFCMLAEQSLILAKGGHIVCVVGNAKHGTLHIPADTIIAEIGKALGLELVEIYVAKYRKNRKEYKTRLRESLVVFRKP